MRVKFITAIYNNLYGTDLGGRPSRVEHYKWSLLSLLKMTNADFLCYTSEDEIDELKNFFYVQNKITNSKLEFRVFNLRKTKFSSLINNIKNIEATKKSDRCIEIQYSKFHWWWNEDKSYDYYYWIDAGLSHCGIIPNKYLDMKLNSYRKYFESTLFNNNFLFNLIKKTGDSFYVIRKENSKYYWSRTVDKKWYKNYDSSYHVIGGLFGGKSDKWDVIVSLFENYVKKIMETDRVLVQEEVIMSLMNANHKELFINDDFDIWWTRDSKPKDLDISYFEDKKCFYHIIEKLNTSYE